MLQSLAPVAVIQPYFRMSGYAYLHIPAKLVKECSVIPGVRFIVFVKDAKIVIEQIKEE